MEIILIDYGIDYVKTILISTLLNKFKYNSIVLENVHNYFVDKVRMNDNYLFFNVHYVSTFFELNLCINNLILIETLSFIFEI